MEQEIQRVRLVGKSYDIPEEGGEEHRLVNFLFHEVCNSTGSLRVSSLGKVIN